MATLLVSIALRSLVLLLVTLMVATLCRRRSAAVVHGIWALGLGGCLLLPLMSWLAPGWNLPLLPAPVAAVHATSIPASAKAPQSRSIPRAAESRRAPNFEPKPLNRKAEATTPSSNSNVPAKRFVWPSLTTLVCAVWIVGAAIILLRLLQQMLVTGRLIRNASVITDRQWIELSDFVARKLGLRRGVMLRSSEDALSPMVAGVVKQTVLLPRDAGKWSSERRQLVLLHELSHVARGDVQTQLLAALSCGVFWFNPLAWWGASQMKRLREIACDDAVVTHTTVAADYAETLLAVAREYRSRQLVGAVAMARTSRVEDRITAILDAARSRRVMTRRSVRLLAFIAFLAAVVVGSCQLSSRSADAAEEAEVANQKHPERTMKVRVVDEAGKPLQGARIHASIWQMDGKRDNYPNRDYTTDEQGIAEIGRPERLKIMRLWPSCEGYVPLFVNFAEGKHEEGRLIPDEYEFRLQKGHRLSGHIVDEEGHPVPNAKVQVRVEVDEPAWGAHPDPMISTWLTDSDFNSPAPVTDSDGHWSIDNAPPPLAGAKDYEFSLWITHPDFSSDKNWGELQKQQGITPQSLRDGISTITLHRGVEIKGVVIRPDGKPVKKGWVVWNDDPYHGQGDWETEIDEQGRFATPPLSPGEYPIIVVAAGCAAQRRMVKAEPDMEELRFELKPGKRIEIQIMDQEGNPIPNAAVYLANTSGNDTWNNSNALHNHKHPNVPDYGVPRSANDDGAYVWDWAPEEAVKYEIGAKGYAAQKAVLVAKPTPHVITLASARVVVGRVTDASTGQPIERFLAIPVIVFRPDFYHTRTTDAKVGQYGQYELPLTGSAGPNDHYRVRFEADGYRSVVSEVSFGPLDGRATLDFSLEPVPARKGRVVDVDGRPVENATVLEASPSDVPNTSNGKPDSWDSRPIPTGQDGNFQLRATAEPVRVRAYHDLGFAEKALAPDEVEVGTLRLQPWAKVTGTLMQGDKPIANEGVSFYPLTNRGLTEARFQDSFYTQTDAEGRFTFDRLPPMSGTVRAYLGPWQDSPMTSSQSLPIELKPGEHREIVLGGSGATLSGRVVATGRNNDDMSKQWSLNYLISRDRGLDYPADAEPLSFDASGPVQAAWLRQPDSHNWIATRENHFVKLADDGTLNVYGVEPGEYDLVIQLYEQPAGCLVETIGEKIVPITVAASQTDSPIELGDIEVECRMGPRVGGDMRAFQFTDADGQVRYVDDLKGRYVLFHAWATWCAPCLQTMPEIVATVEKYADQRFTPVGLNLDKDTAVAKAMADEQGWAWAQNYLGEDSDLMNQLAISTAPAYFLIGPDGKLLGSANDWHLIAELLERELP
jgi:beta-lactamase regulating signal transducer with metallopeptidase domain/uncharacterized GH25 family protein/thiol-disulfide isomerase/thioredoxin